MGGFGQQLPPQQLTVLPNVLEENSGMVVLSADSILFINDSGNPPIVFLTDTLGNILHQTYISNFANKDWEELTFDGNNRIFIGDFGNNANARQNLKIGAFRLNELLTQDTVQTEYLINLSYQRQTAFPPVSQQLHYDMEAMIFNNDSLYLFSKNRTDPFNGKVYQYTLPALAGTYHVAPVDSFVSGAGVMASFWITGAAYKASDKHLVLLGYDKLWSFRNVNPPFFFNGNTPTIYAFNTFTQKECVDFVNDTLLYISDESSFAGTQNLYKAQFNSPSFALSELKNSSELTLLTTQIKDTLELNLKTDKQVKVVFEVFSVDGKRPLYGKLGNFEKGEHKLIINAERLDPGGYVLNVLIDGVPNAYRFTKPYQFKN